MGSPELSVVCKNCGEEVSPYVTECPYCGTRLRKRAPKLERVGDEVRVQEDRRTKRRRKVAERRAARTASFDLAARPAATITLLAASAIVLIVDRATNLSIVDLGALFGPVGGDWWRYFAAPFTYDNVGYLFACGLGIAIFMPALERRLGAFPTVLLAIACGALGMLATDAIESAIGDGFPIAAGGNGIALGLLACWVVIRHAERRADPTEEYDVIAVAGAAAVLLLLPLVDDWASVWAGLAGGAVGAACGAVATFGGRLPAGR